MATKNAPLSVIAGTDPQSMPPVPTPENTPVPGGGRYRWSDSAPHWLEIDEGGNPLSVIAGTDPQSMPPVTLGA